jgi:hypothetical protein
MLTLHISLLVKVKGEVNVCRLGKRNKRREMNKSDTIPASKLDLDLLNFPEGFGYIARHGSYKVHPGFIG